MNSRTKNRQLVHALHSMVERALGASQCADDDDVLSDRERAAVDLGSPYERVTATMSNHADVLDMVTVPRFVAWDLWPSNAMTVGGRLVAVVDPEWAIFGDPLMEAGLLGKDLPIFGDVTAFARGYGRPALDRSEQVRRRLYTLYLTLVMIIEPSYRDAQDPHQVAWCRERLTALLDALDSPDR